MSTLTAELRDQTQTARLSVNEHRVVHHAYMLLYVAFILAPIIAGLDKFFDVLVRWDQYLAPVVASSLPVTPHVFMMIVGAIEIIAGLVVLFWPSVGAWVVAIWLWAIILNLLLGRGHYDIALRDAGLSLGALALAQLCRLSPWSFRMST